MSRYLNARKALPPEIVKCLQDKYAGDVVWVPVRKRRQFKRRGNVARNRQIRRARSQGATYRELVERFNLSLSQVWEIVQGRSAED